MQRYVFLYRSTFDGSSCFQKFFDGCLAHLFFDYEGFFRQSGFVRDFNGGGLPGGQLYQRGFKPFDSLVVLLTKDEQSSLERFLQPGYRVLLCLLDCLYLS